MKTLLVLFLFVFAMNANIDVQSGDQTEKAIELLGQPEFEFSNTVEEGHWKVKFDVYGWVTDSCWYGINSQNDVIITFYKFDLEEDYICFITN